jgi:small metal-binding protein
MEVSMTNVNCMKTVMGGLSLLLLLSACSSGSKTRTAANPPVRSSDTVTDRRTIDDRGTAYDPMDRMTAKDQMATERPVPHDRLGTGDGRVVPCADDKGDITASSDCVPQNRDRVGDRRVDTRAGLAAACSSRVDAQGRLLYDDPACPDRYYNDRAADDRATRAAANCSSRIDAKGNVVYDDPACPARYRRQMGSSFENVRWTQESAFYDRYADKAVKHARQAEIAGNQGHVPEMLRHAELSLDQAKEAQRVGHQPDLDAGIVALREAITFGQTSQAPAAASSIRDARIKLSRAAGIQPVDVRPVNELATATARPRTQTVRGELARNTRPTAGGVTGGEHYILRDRQNREVPIALSPEMSRQVQVGDVVEAQVDSEGHVTSISKAQ